MANINFTALPQIAVNVGDVTPVPDPNQPYAWSTTLGAPVKWNSVAWVRPSPDAPAVYVQDTAPSTPTLPYIWWQTNVNANGDYTLWFYQP